MVLLGDLEFCRIRFKGALLYHQNNFVEILKIMSIAVKNFDILVTLSVLLYIIILMVQQNCFSDLYPAKVLDLSAKPFFPCTVCDMSHHHRANIRTTC